MFCCVTGLYHTTRNKLQDSFINMTMESEFKFPHTFKRLTTKIVMQRRPETTQQCLHSDPTLHYTVRVLRLQDIPIAVTQKLGVLSTHCNSAIHMTVSTKSDDFPQHVNLLLFVIDNQYFLCEVGTENRSRYHNNVTCCIFVPCYEAGNRKFTFL